MIVSGNAQYDFKGIHLSEPPPPPKNGIKVSEKALARLSTTYRKYINFIVLRRYTCKAHTPSKPQNRLQTLESESLPKRFLYLAFLGFLLGNRFYFPMLFYADDVVVFISKI